jgi:plastocyanin
MLMKGFAAIAVLACLGAWPLAAPAGEVHGHILITKGLTKKRLALPDYQFRGVSMPAHVDQPSAIDEFSRVVIYVDGPPEPPQQPATVTLAQHDTQFKPEILVIPVGSKVAFPNDDPVFHNVFSLSKAKQFDLGYYPAGKSKTLTFDKAGIVQVYCHIHRDMNAAIVVVPNGWYTQPDKDGTFSLPRIPAGTQHIVVWHKSVGFFRKRVEVPESGGVELSVAIPVPSTE